MRIITKGVPAGERPRLINCRECESLLEYVITDVVKNTETPDPPYASSQDWVVCPVCKERIYVTGSEPFSGASSKDH